MRPTTPRARAAVAALTIAVFGLFAVQPATSAPAQLTFRQSGLVGGGFVNVLAADPSDPSHLLAGGDVSGFHTSTDGGATWTTSNTGIQSLGQIQVATMLFSTATPGLVYAGVGKKGTAGGLLVSQDGGRSWSLRSAVPQFSAGDNEGIAALPHTHPRSTGALLAEDASGGFLYAATFKQGVMRSDDGGRTWTTLGLAGKYLRGLAIDPADPDRLYVGAYNDGVYVTTTASTTGTFSKIVGSPTWPEELLALGDSLYVAGGKAGVFRTRNGGSTWQQLGGSAVPTSGPLWESIVGYRACGRDVIYAGSKGGRANSIVRSTDDGATWASVTADTTSIHRTIGGPGGPTWWLGGTGAMILGGGGYVASSILTGTGTPGGADCLDPDVRVAGRSGIWGSQDEAQDWYPMMRGLGVSIARDVAGDPSIAGRTYVAAADWVFLYSSDGLDSVTQKKATGVVRGTDISIDPGTSRVYIGAGKPSTNGEVFSSANPVTTGWTDENLSGVAGGRVPLAVAAQTSGTQRTLLAAVEGNGIWRKLGGTWTKVNAVAMASWQPSRGSSFAWAPGATNVYLFDHESGVWRSNDRGKTWTKIWNIRSSVAGTGYLAVDPSDPGRLYVSTTGTGVYRIDGATSGSVDAGTLTPTLVYSSPSAGPIETDGAGNLWLALNASANETPGLYRSDDAGSTWSPMSDAAYAAAALFPYDLWIAPDGRVFVATNGNGVLVGTPS
jgi:photosystem II stability/assembly factor-like uncharacterized protein